MDTPIPQKRSALPALLRDGSAMVAAGGAPAALVLLAVFGAGWWTLRTNQASRREGREATLLATAQMLAATGEQFIAQGQLSQLRTLIAGAAGQHHLQAVRVALPEPRSIVIAESSPAEGVGYEALPEAWLDLHAPPNDMAMEHTSDGRARLVMTMRVPGKGPVVLEVEDGVSTTMWSDWRTQTGLGIVGAAALLGLAGFHRSVSRRYRSVGAISESLTAMHAGEADTGALLVDRSFGPEAEAFNGLLAERDAMRSKLTNAGAEQKLGDRRGRDGDLFSLCDAMWQGLLLVDEQMKIKFVNGACAVFLRSKREDMIGKDAAAFLTDPKVLESLRALAGGAGRGRTVVEVQGAAPGSPDGKNAAPAPGGPNAGSVLRFSIRPVRKEDNAAAVIVIEDVTQQRVADEARHSFVATATHELRTPLTNMRLYIDSLLERPDQDVQTRTKAVNVVSQEARRLERMVGDMLSVAQIESGSITLNRGDVRIDAVFAEVERDFSEQAEQKQIKLRFDLPPKWPRIEGDRDKIVMALHNLIGNAIKYTPAGGEVVVRATAEGQSFSVDIVDNGIGIKDEEQALVFERFYRAKDRRIANITGTGLGLAIAREVVRLHGGEISLRSVIDKGSTFTMTLPAKAA